MKWFLKNLLTNYLDQNVLDYSYFNAENWYTKFKNKYNKQFQFTNEELDQILEYLEKIEEDSK